jgi:hypothetical protein
MLLGAENKHSFTKTFKEEMKQFGLLLNTIKKDDNLFEPDNYTPNVNDVSTKDVKQFKSFYTLFQNNAGEDIAIDGKTQKFLLFLYSTADNPEEAHTYEGFDCPVTSEHIRDHLDNIQT